MKDAKKLLDEEEEKMAKGEDIKDVYTEEELRARLLRGVPKVEDNIDKFNNKSNKAEDLFKGRISEVIELFSERSKGNGDTESDSDISTSTSECESSKSSSVNYFTSQRMNKGTQTVMRTKACVLL